MRRIRNRGWTRDFPPNGVSKSQVSRLCGEIDERVNAFLNRPLEGEWPYLWLDATYIKARKGGRIASVAAIVAVGVNSEPVRRHWFKPARRTGAGRCWASRCSPPRLRSFGTSSCDP